MRQSSEQRLSKLLRLLTPSGSLLLVHGKTLDDVCVKGDFEILRSEIDGTDYCMKWIRQEPTPQSPQEADETAVLVH